MDRAETYEIRSMTDQDRGDVLDALTAAFARRFDDNWFDWKHAAGPWGPTLAWVARDEQGLLGVRMLMPWMFRSGGREYSALRPCDTVTAERARGRGVFRRLTESAMAEVGSNVDLFFNTPNTQSRPGYLKMGFSTWSSVAQRLGLVVPARSELGAVTAVGMDTDPAGETMCTDRSEAFFEWRYRRCPWYQYEIRALANSLGANGIVFRVRRSHGLRTIVVAEFWGSRAEKRALLKAAAAEMSAHFVWLTEVHRRSIPISSRWGNTDVTHFKVTREDLPVPIFALGDIEDVL